MSLAERADDPQQRLDLLRFARMWMSLTEDRRLAAPEIAEICQTIFVSSQRLQYSVQCRNYSDGARASGWVAVTCRPLPETVPLHGLFWMQRFGKRLPWSSDRARSSLVASFSTNFAKVSSSIASFSHYCGCSASSAIGAADAAVRLAPHHLGHARTKGRH
jgi:hypothetical protein